MSIFAGIKDAESYKGGRYIVPGRWKLEVTQLKAFTSTKQAGRSYFAAEFKVHETNTDNTEFTPGSRVDWLVDMQQASALGNISAFAQSLTPGATGGDITQEVMEELVGANQPANGVVVIADAYTVKTKAGKDFTKVDWSAVADD